MSTGVSGTSTTIASNVLPSGASMVDMSANFVNSSGSFYKVNGSFYVTTTGWFSINYVSSSNTLLFRQGGSDTGTFTTTVYYTK